MRRLLVLVLAGAAYAAGHLTAPDVSGRLSWLVTPLEATYRASIVKSIQACNISITSTSTSSTCTITAVTLNNAVLITNGFGSESSATEACRGMIRATLTNTTTVTGTRCDGGTPGGAHTATLKNIVVEYFGSVLKSAVQRGSAAPSGSPGTANSTITSVNTAKSVVFLNGGEQSDDAAINTSHLPRTTLTSSTNVQIVGNGTVGWHVVEFR